MPDPTLSPDGLYYWDGTNWVSTLSHDGRTRWNGTAWVPVSSATGPAMYQAAPAAARVPTSWTRPLQYSVAGFYAAQGIWSAIQPIFLAGPMSDYAHQIAQQQQNAQLSANGATPADFSSFMTGIVDISLWVGAAIGIAIAVVAIVGALKRWTWIFYVILVLLALTTISLPLSLVSAAATPFIPASVHPPAVVTWVGVVLDIPAAALAVWMLVAVIQRGPWAMTRQRAS